MKYGLVIRSEPLDSYGGYRPLSYPEIIDLALSVETYGFDSVHVDDHIIGFDPERKEPYLEAMVLMGAIATETFPRQNHVVCTRAVTGDYTDGGKIFRKRK
jgi:hypothetical protein